MQQALAPPGLHTAAKRGFVSRNSAFMLAKAQDGAAPTTPLFSPPASTRRQPCATPDQQTRTPLRDATNQQRGSTSSDAKIVLQPNQQPHRQKQQPALSPSAQGIDMVLKLVSRAELAEARLAAALRRINELEVAAKAASQLVAHGLAKAVAVQGGRSAAQLCISQCGDKGDGSGDDDVSGGGGDGGSGGATLCTAAPSAGAAVALQGLADIFARLRSQTDDLAASVAEHAATRVVSISKTPTHSPAKSSPRASASVGHAAPTMGDGALTAPAAATAAAQTSKGANLDTPLHPVMQGLDTPLSAPAGIGVHHRQDQHRHQRRLPMTGGAVGQQQHRRARKLKLSARIEAATLAQFGEWSSGVWVLPNDRQRQTY